MTRLVVYPMPYRLRRLLFCQHHQLRPRCWACWVHRADVHVHTVLTVEASVRLHFGYHHELDFAAGGAKGVSSAIVRVAMGLESGIGSPNRVTGASMNAVVCAIILSTKCRSR